MPIFGPSHPDWSIFVEKLEGPEGCDFHEKEPGNASSIAYRCSGGHQFTRRILAKYWPGCDIRGSLAYFTEHGGDCDCKILFNIAPEHEEGRG